MTIEEAIASFERKITLEEDPSEECRLLAERYIQDQQPLSVYWLEQFGFEHFHEDVYYRYNPSIEVHVGEWHWNIPRLRINIPKEMEPHTVGDMRRLLERLTDES